jgi:YebC/PmpR family DNA-binding regulatory protein
MAGHSKWANIRHRKGAQDARRGKIFTRLIREITVAARMGDPDPSMNPRLRLAIDKAKAESMPKDNIERAIRRGAGHMEGSDYQEVRYEGYGPGGTAVLVECLTDNRNRTVADVRHAFSRHGGNLGSDGSVGYLFNHCGLISYGAGVDEHAVLEAALEAGAEDVVTNDDGSIDVITQPQSLEAVRDAMRRAGLRADSAEVTMRPEALAHLAEDQAESMLRMVDMLEELDDVQNVYTNADIDAEVLERLAD